MVIILLLVSCCAFVTPDPCISCKDIVVHALNCKKSTGNIVKFKGTDKRDSTHGPLFEEETIPYIPGILFTVLLTLCESLIDKCSPPPFTLTHTGSVFALLKGRRMALTVCEALLMLLTFEETEGTPPPKRNSHYTPSVLCS